MKKITVKEWHKGLTPEDFKDIFFEWYIPAIKNKFYLLEERIKKLEKPGK